MSKDRLLFGGLVAVVLAITACVAAAWPPDIEAFEVEQALSRFARHDLSAMRMLQVRGMLVPGSFKKFSRGCGVSFRLRRQSAQGSRPRELRVEYDGCALPDNFCDLSGPPGSETETPDLFTVFAEGLLVEQHGDVLLVASQFRLKFPGQYEAFGGPSVDELCQQRYRPRDYCPPCAHRMQASRAPRQPKAASAPAAAASKPFVHPGILVNRAMLELVKRKIAAGEQPWRDALAQASASDFGQLGYTAHPRAVVDCGSYSNPDHGCSDEKNDVLAAYTHALLWAYTGNEANAKKSIEIMNAWSAILKDHTNRNAPLQSAWAAEVWPRAAEIIRYTYPRWPPSEVARFGKLLRDVYLPQVVNGSGKNGNWETSMVEATLNIGVFNDDRASFDHALQMWRARTPAYIYISQDGATPIPPPRGEQPLSEYWYGQTTPLDGMAQETCRDLNHAQYGLAGIINAAETALLQGVDLYGEQAQRLRAGLEFHAKYLNGAAVPPSLCGGSLNRNSPNPMWEIALNHFVTRQGGTLPETEKLALRLRPTGTDHHVGWETLTHAGVGAPK